MSSNYETKPYFGRLSAEEALRSLRNGDPVWLKVEDVAAHFGVPPETLVHRGEQPKPAWWRRMLCGSVALAMVLSVSAHAETQDFWSMDPGVREANQGAYTLDGLTFYKDIGTHEACMAAATELARSRTPRSCTVKTCHPYVVYCVTGRPGDPDSHRDMIKSELAP